MTYELNVKGASVIHQLFLMAPENIPFACPSKSSPGQRWGSVHTDRIPSFAAEVISRLQGFSLGSVPPRPRKNPPPKNLPSVLERVLFVPIVIDKSRCFKCKSCVKKCPSKSISIEDSDSSFPVVDGNTCLHCCRCINACPANALSMSGLQARQQYQFKQSVLAQGQNYPTIPEMIPLVLTALVQMHPTFFKSTAALCLCVFLLLLLFYWLH